MSYERLSNRRKRIISEIMQLLGNKCVVCGYDRCQRALEVHHIDPTKKNFSVSNGVRDAVSHVVMIEELKKCTLLCANCHREYHDGMIDVEFVSSFDEGMLDSLYRKCPECNDYIVTFGAVYCSKTCTSKANCKKSDLKAQVRKAKSVWKNTDVVNLLSRHNGVMTSAAQEIGLSANGVKRRFKKITGYDSWKSHIHSLPVRIC